MKNNKLVLGVNHIPNGEVNSKIKKYDEPITLEKLEKVLDSLCSEQKKKDPFESFWNGLSYKDQIILNDVMKRYAESQGSMIVYGKRRNPEIHIHKGRSVGYSKKWEDEIKPIDLKIPDNIIKAIENQELYRKHIYGDFTPIIQPDFRKNNSIPIHKNK